MTLFCNSDLSFQGLYRFLDPKFKIFADFFQNKNFFFQTQGYQIGEQ